MYESFKLAFTTLVLPPGGPILLVLLGVLAWRRHPRAGRILSAAGALSLWLLSLPVVSAALVDAMGGGRPVDPSAAATAEAIVILGGGVRVQAPDYGGDTLGRLTLERVRYGALLARRTGLPVLVTGGATRDGVRPEAHLMRESLEREFGIAVRWVEDRARDTRQNAANAARVLGAEGKRRVLLVMHGFDVRRATALFEAAGLEVVAAPTLVPRLEGLEPSDLLPSAGALAVSHFALYEAAGLARDAVAGRLSGPR